ncbi:hypothetical protein ACFFTM_01730 [Pseudoduganella plicata]|uniref:hypothetical protein n=1 Tax=Pseudoduganella plicata TaxID=321984 RepID=UPI001E4E5935|nr:hypothetical protein [Pseudoduganella plicata]
MNLDHFLSSRTLDLDIVQDATVTASGEGKTAPQLLLDELSSMLDPTSTSLYLCCVNRGVLDDALILALERRQIQEQLLLEDITRAVGLSSDAPSCWPLAGHNEVAIWPMDAESLLVAPAPGVPSPAEALVRHATNSADWPALGECPAGTSCPFCQSQTLLDRHEERTALLQILRWHELGSGKRWSFRDLFSLMSYLLAGQYHASSNQLATPCEWAAGLRRLDEAGRLAKRPHREQLTALFYLATSGYQHALFHQWDHLAAASLGQDLKDLAIGELDQGVGNTLRGMQYFLQDRRKPYLPATITASLAGLSASMDPALASPDFEVHVSGRSKAFLWDIDSRFSRSLADGIEFMRRRQALSSNELELLSRLATADKFLSLPEARRKRPGTAGRVQRTLRDFACRLVRRSICTRSAVVADAATLRNFQLVVEEDHGKRIYEVGQQVKKLLNNSHGFEVSLTTTFGQPLPPRQRQAILVVQPQPVSPIPSPSAGRPPAPIRFLRVGQGRSAQPIALTYDLFKAVEELERGLSMASLPRTVVAMLDATRAKLAGPIVRDRNALEDARITLGGDGAYIGQSWDGFVVLERNSNDES